MRLSRLIISAFFIVFGWNLLGLELQAAEFRHTSADAAAEQAMRLPESKLPLVIRGVIASSNPMNSVVIVQNTRSGELLTVKAGAKLFDTWKIFRVQNADTVIVKRANRYEYIGVKPHTVDL